MKKIFLLFFVFLLACCAPFARISAKIMLPAFFSDNMVLQQNTTVRLFGEASASSTVTITTDWDHQTTQTLSDAAGKWEIPIQTPAAGGPYQLRISDGEPLTLKNVLIGEVWFCSGQSNMEIPMKGFGSQPVKKATDYLLKATPDVPIRVFNADSKDGDWVRQFSKTPQADCQGEWLVHTAKNISNVSAIGYLFAYYLRQALQVPVGIIVSSRGGSRVEAWMSERALTPFSNEVDLSILTNNEQISSDTETPCVLYNSKIAPFAKYGIKGFIWYQGESNIGQADLYKRLMPAFVQDLRRLWQRGELPFYFVEIAPFSYQDPNAISAALLREAQQQNERDIPNCGMVSTLDVGDSLFIHPGEKEVVGKRLAMWALSETYGWDGLVYKTPVYQSMEIKEDRALIQIDRVNNGLCPLWHDLDGFEIAGDDRVFYPAKARIDEKNTSRVIVSSPRVTHPVAVRYAFKNYTKASVFTTSGIPLAPFRTDRW